jgi:hypothetical protein
MNKITPSMRIKLKQMMLNQEALYNQQGEIEAAKLRAGVPALSQLESEKARLRQLMAIDKQSDSLAKDFKRKATKKKPRY